MAGWECAVIGDAAGLSAMEWPWLELGQRAKARPFQTFGWHAAWLATLGAASGYRPRVAVLHRGERLLGVLPLARRVHRGLRLLEWSAHGVADYNDALLDPEVDPEAALAALWRAAGSRADLARLTHVLPDTPCDRFLAARSTRSTAGETSWAVPLPGPDGAAWVASLSPGVHRNFHRYTRKLAEAGARFDVLSPTEPREPFLDALIDQKWAWFAEQGATTFLDGPAGRAFVRAVTERMAAQGILHLAALRAGDRFVACMLSFAGEGTLYTYMVSRDRAWDRLSPGQTLFAQLIRWCGDNGFSEVDLLCGDQAFKQRLGARPVTLRNHLLPCSPLGRVALAAWKVAQAAVRGRSRLPPGAAGGGREAATGAGS